VPGHRFALGVQWHPERCADGPGGSGRRIAEGLVAAASAA
jgi:gamma-glutamyl-gamma-aminobutyrate hydrolase PuuD